MTSKGYSTKRKAEQAAVQYLKESLSNQPDDVQRVNVKISLTRFLGAGRTKADISWQLTTDQTTGFE
jgi:hypothetical protein